MDAMQLRRVPVWGICQQEIAAGGWRFCIGMAPSPVGTAASSPTIASMIGLAPIGAPGSAIRIKLGGSLSLADPFPESPTECTGAPTTGFTAKVRGAKVYLRPGGKTG